MKPDINRFFVLRYWRTAWFSDSCGIYRNECDREGQGNISLPHLLVLERAVTLLASFCIRQLSIGASRRRFVVLWRIFRADGSVNAWRDTSLIANRIVAIVGQKASLRVDDYAFVVFIYEFWQYTCTFSRYNILIKMGFVTLNVLEIFAKRKFTQKGYFVYQFNQRDFFYKIFLKIKINLFSYRILRYLFFDLVYGSLSDFFRKIRLSRSTDPTFISRVHAELVEVR